MTPDDPSYRRVVLAATVPGIVAAMPAFLVGATGVLMRDDLGFGTAGMGAAVSVFFVATSLGAVFTGRLTERIGAGWALRGVCLGSGVMLLLMAVGARGYAWVVVLLAVAGVVNSTFQPASNLALARRAHPRQALMFGVKQAAIPLATLLAGALVPLVALQFGWRWAFAAAGAGSLCLVAVVPSYMGAGAPANLRRRDLHDDAPTAPLIWLSIAAGFGTAGATAMATFLVDTATAYRLTIANAGWLLVAGSVAGIVARLVAGGLADRYRGRSLQLVAGMLVVGGLGYAAGSMGNPTLLLVGTFLGYAFGWGWTGLMMFATVRLNPGAPAAASGIVLAGAAAGAALGPLAFGHLVNHVSIQGAWRASAAATAVAAALVLAARSRLLAARAASPTAMR